MGRWIGHRMHLMEFASRSRRLGKAKRTLCLRLLSFQNAFECSARAAAPLSEEHQTCFSLKVLKAAASGSTASLPLAYLHYVLSLIALLQRGAWSFEAILASSLGLKVASLLEIELIVLGNLCLQR